MALDRSNTLRRIAAAAAIGFVLTSPAMLAGCDVADGGNDLLLTGGTASTAATALTSPDGSLSKSTSRSSILSAIINAFANRRDANRDVIRNL
ncbi:MAG: hypothetical protein ACKVS9_13155 [Phycisphaerae bacterium]